ncbi:MAG: macro domain-containing protein [Anaerolineales bacterium]|nr:macro domain-containing protein [Anaerolineales bacterium]
MNALLAETTIPSGQTLQLVQGDITTEHVNAIVNAANEHLQHGGGVAWAIIRRGGDVIQRESDEWVRIHGPVSHAEPAWTSSGALPAKYVIHAVGPVWNEGDEDVKLAAAVTGSLNVAERLGLLSLAMPALSTGIFGFPKQRAAGVLFSVIQNHFSENPASTLKQVRIVLYDQATVNAFLRIWHDYFQS